ncbi:serine hydrolase domain-containing protein [Larkinella knui]|nr:serine hydrolase domain-containing protein [Larkinella knui]
MKRLLVGVLASCLLLAACDRDLPPTPVISNNPMRSTLDSTVETAMRPYFANARHVGSLIGIYRKGAVSWYGYGETKRGSGQLPTMNTLFEIGSVTKPFTAALVLDWLQRHQLPVDTPIARYLPDYSRRGVASLTFRQLLDYSSGLPEDDAIADLKTAPGYTSANPYQHYDSTRVYAYLKNYGVKYPPGTRYTYSNLAFGLAGLILERMTHTSFETLVRERIAAPLELANTGVTLTAGQQSQVAQGYLETGEPAPRWVSLGGFNGAGALVSTGSDLMRFGQAQLRSETALEKLFAQTRTLSFVSPEAGREGLGWDLTSPEFDGVVKTGGTGGFSSLIMVSQARQLVVVVLFNNHETAAIETAASLTAALLKQ